MCGTQASSVLEEGTCAWNSCHREPFTPGAQALLSENPKRLFSVLALDRPRLTRKNSWQDVPWTPVITCEVVELDVLITTE